jgi:predicted AAA+ superfamily ATPase
LDESTIKLFPRFSVDQVKAALIDTPVVMVTGPRQCGKTTLVRGFTSHQYITLDDDTEVDIIVEGEGGELVGIEVKAAATVTVGDFNGLRKLSAACGEDFKLGVVLYDAEQTVPFGERMFAAPISCLWA